VCGSMIEKRREGEYVCDRTRVVERAKQVALP
jgi:hypothetical protein